MANHLADCAFIDANPVEVHVDFASVLANALRANAANAAGSARFVPNAPIPAYLPDGRVQIGFAGGGQVNPCIEITAMPGYTSRTEGGAGQFNINRAAGGARVRVTSTRMTLWAGGAPWVNEDLTLSHLCHNAWCHRGSHHARRCSPSTRAATAVPAARAACTCRPASRPARTSTARRRE